MATAVAIVEYKEWDEARSDPVNFGPEPIHGLLNGQTEARIVARFGPGYPWQGHYSQDPKPPVKMPDVTSVVYAGRWGNLYVAYRSQGGGLVCFDSVWMPKGTAF